MISPNKYTNINLSVIGISSTILEILKKEDILTYEQLLFKIVGIKWELVKQNFLESLIFLHILWKIEYFNSSDTIKLNT